MDCRVRVLNRHLREHDSKLYAQETHIGRIDIYRRSSLGCNPPHFLFALTDTWTVTGRPVDWGIEPIINRVKAMDLWRDDSLVEDLIESYEEDEKSKERSLHNSVEAYLYDIRKQFAKSTDGVNTSLLAKNAGRQFKEGLRP